MNYNMEKEIREIVSKIVEELARKKEQPKEKRGIPKHCKGFKVILMKEEELLEFAYKVYGIYQKRQNKLYEQRLNSEIEEENVDDYEILYDIADWETQRIFNDNDIDSVVVVYEEEGRERYVVYDEDVFKGVLIDLVIDIESGELI